MTVDTFNAVKFERPRISNGLPIRLAVSAEVFGRIEAWRYSVWLPGKADFSDWFTATCVSPEELASRGVPTTI